MFLATISLIVVVLIFMIVVNFVLSNLSMFQTPFDIVLTLPLTGWSHTLEGVQFMYIIAGSVLVGALVIAVSTWVFDAKRKMKVKHLRKEQKRLQEAVNTLNASLPPEDTAEENEEATSGYMPNTPAEEPPPDVPDASSATPEDIRRSFEHTLSREEDELFPSDHDQDQAFEDEEREKDLRKEADRELPQEAPIEAELVDNEEEDNEETEKDDDQPKSQDAEKS
ncbi:hypothetical protein GF339_23595 [candidate division KSB3 bacterium]|uniref:Uncharacterized protein n=1 Tax=candidate division KSB3 bacterium TaxID=2044937 RepID=A0A9D5K0L4_9BACT|nr:hypothetical protein [candidate division KSB3 bacterium]MBD3327588.1 hypothetical protein [candidate division KSB3 bacterium]